jgi:hypothetical protein
VRVLRCPARFTAVTQMGPQMTISHR